MKVKFDLKGTEIVGDIVRIEDGIATVQEEIHFKLSDKEVLTHRRNYAVPLGEIEGVQHEI